MNDQEIATKFFSKVCAPSQFEGEGVCSGCEKENGTCALGSNNLYFGHSGAFRCLVEELGDLAFVRGDTALLYSMEGPYNQSWSKKSVRDFMYLCPKGGCREINGYPGSCSFGAVPANVIMASNSIRNKKKLLILQRLTNDTWRDALHAGKRGSSHLLSPSMQQLAAVKKLTRYLCIFMQSTFNGHHLFLVCNNAHVDGVYTPNYARGHLSFYNVSTTEHRNYASSSWSLDELVKIVECKETIGQKVLPVFYQVDPTDVQELTGSFADAFVKHRKEFKHNLDKVEKWSQALMEIANLKGWDSQVIKPESKLIEEIVADISKKLSVWGMAGIGKTTIAGAIFDRISAEFEGKFFVPDVREELKRARWNKLSKKKILIVLDDVTSSQQLKSLIGELSLYGLGTRIIVTSRDKQVLKNGCTKIYEVKKLNYSEALYLFRIHAFKQNHPTEGLMELSKRSVNYAKGIPLALKVLGSDLCDQGIEEWESELAKLQGSPKMEIQNILKISYDGLDENEKNIFLDIACFFKGELGMHNLLQQMGKRIVYQQCIKQPGKRSRLWNYKDIYHVLTKDKGIEAVEGISADLSRTRDLKLSSTAFESMS
ncbi:transferrin, putative [Ricinus communis]|uniref:Transferrin, putative n=1 Tax=Ricinus communis TaxID=3988 RepID=B9T880_RICCO|nr:transferrin, putative [Ricinus communis]